VKHPTGSLGYGSLCELCNNKNADWPLNLVCFSAPVQFLVWESNPRPSNRYLPLLQLANGLCQALLEQRVPVAVNLLGWVLQRSAMVGSRLADAAWRVCEHRSGLVSYSKFSLAHRVSEQAELLFFRGYAGENSRYGLRATRK